jgi:hypothetical protein
VETGFREAIVFAELFNQAAVRRPDNADTDQKKKHNDDN